mgnify:CR=1 FL=1
MKTDKSVNHSSPERFRFRLQRKEAVARPNILGGRSFPVHTYRWRDVAASNYRFLLEKMIPPESKSEYRIEDTGPES